MRPVSGRESEGCHEVRELKKKREKMPIGSLFPDCWGGKRGKDSKEVPVKCSEGKPGVGKKRAEE